MAINTHILIITLNVNGPNTPIQTHRVTEWIKKNLYATLKRLILDLKTPADWKWRDEKIIIIQTVIKRKPGKQYLYHTKQTLKQSLTK